MSYAEVVIPPATRGPSRNRADDRARPPSPSPRPARLLAALGTDRSRSLAEHRANAPRPPAPGKRPDRRLIALVEEAGLTGRGGAGFPTGRKLRAVAERPGPRVVVPNCTEGEPASSKDSLLATLAPHLILDGALVAAAAVAADKVIVCVDRTQTRACDSLQRALDERLRAEQPGCDISIVQSPPRYVAGEETALVQLLNGGPAKPTLAPPRPFERGVGRRPTLVQNAETLAHMAQIAAYGADWFRQLGTDLEPGTALYTVSMAESAFFGQPGAPGAPGRVIEAPLGTPVGEVLAAAGVREAQAVLVGGYFGSWVPGAALAELRVSRASLARFGASPGAGVLRVVPHGACGLAETASVLAWYASESAGQCGPCAFGLPALAATTADLARGRASGADLNRLVRWASEIEGRGACRHPDGAVRLLRSALTVFADDVDLHRRGSPCGGAKHALQIAATRPARAVPVVWR